MEASKLSFTKKTQDKMNKKMSVREKGKVLFARLQELDNDGTLSKAKSRADVARLVGYTEERAKAGYVWVSNLIRRGHVKEIIQEWTPSGRKVAEYHLAGSMPDYGYEEVNRRRAQKEAIANEWEKQQNHEIESPISKDIKTDTHVKLEIARGDITIKVEFVEAEQATNLITAILKGDNNK